MFWHAPWLYYTIDGDSTFILTPTGDGEKKSELVIY